MLRERLTARMNPSPLVRKSDQRRAHSSPRRQPVAMAPMNALNRYLSVQPKNQLRVNCDDDSTLLSMVAQRLGVTAMPELCLQNPTESVCVLELTPPTKRVICKLPAAAVCVSGGVMRGSCTDTRPLTGTRVLSYD